MIGCILLVMYSVYHGDNKNIRPAIVIGELGYTSFYIGYVNRQGEYHSFDHNHSQYILVSK